MTMNFVTYEVAQDLEGRYHVTAFEFDEPSRKFAHFDRFSCIEDAIDRSNELAEEDEFNSVEELEVAEDWTEMVVEEDNLFNEEFRSERTPDIYEVMFG